MCVCQYIFTSLFRSWLNVTRPLLSCSPFLSFQSAFRASGQSCAQCPSFLHNLHFVQLKKIMFITRTQSTFPLSLIPSFLLVSPVLLCWWCARARFNLYNSQLHLSLPLSPSRLCPSLLAVVLRRAQHALMWLSAARSAIRCSLLSPLVRSLVSVRSGSSLADGTPTCPAVFLCPLVQPYRCVSEMFQKVWHNSLEQTLLSPGNNG